MLELLMILMDIVEESVCDEKLPELLDNLQEVLVTFSLYSVVVEDESPRSGSEVEAKGARSVEMATPLNLYILG